MQPSTIYLATIALSIGVVSALPQSDVFKASSKPAAYEFEAPVRLTAGGEPIAVEAPGYAAPCLADTDGDGHQDLIVGQFNDGKMMVYRNLGDGILGEKGLAKGQWLQAAGKTAIVPDVW